MNEEKSKIRKHKLTSGILMLIAVISTIICIAKATNGDDTLGVMISIYLLFIVDITMIVIFIGAFTLSCRLYKYSKYTIVVYAGWYHNYMKVDGIIVDEHNTAGSFIPIKLSCTLQDGALVDVTISNSNRIALKINNRLYNGEK